MQCQHTELLGANCKACGTFLSASGPALVEAELRFQPRVSIKDMSQGMYAHQGTNRLFHPASPYVLYRRLLVDWVCETAEQVHLHPITAHAAVALMDTLLAIQEVDKPKLQLMAVCCLLVAAKFEEVDDRAPSLSLLFVKCNRKFSIAQLRTTELSVLQQLNWELKSSTPMHFILHFVSQGVIFPSDTIESHPVTSAVVRYVRKYAEFFADLCLQEYDFQKYSSGLLACACIAAARVVLKVEPAWSGELEQMTEIKVSEVTPTLSHILQ